MENADESNDAQPRRTASAASKCCMAKAVVAKILRRLSNREVNTLALPRFQPWRRQGGLHLLKETVVIARDRAAADQIVVASRQQRRNRDRAFETCTGLVEAADLREQIA
jgi:hypothetical protein